MQTSECNTNLLVVHSILLEADSVIADGELPRIVERLAHELLFSHGEEVLRYRAFTFETLAITVLFPRCALQLDDFSIWFCLKFVTVFL